ncbi:pepsin/retropepsin-like aspartic protease family protein, partial [Sandarakinorhabdus oryzae]|uniref:aspartyl protease family protein n=1 Tax=Sandarakinorhabdus oryzae TaxID=2675220 RepID=UPI0012E0E84C
AASTPGPPAPLPPLVLPAAAPLVAARIDGQPVLLTVDFGADPLVMLNPATVARLKLAAPNREDVERGLFRVAVGQVTVVLPYSREWLEIAGRPIPHTQVLAPKVAPSGQAASSDGVIGVGLLPHDDVQLQFRPATRQDRATTLDAAPGSASNALMMRWSLPGSGRIELELHPLRPGSVASVAAASRLAKAGNGALTGPVRRVEVAFGVDRPVRNLHLAHPLNIAGVMLRDVDVRLFDWAGKAELPPDADASEGDMVTGKRGRQRGWPILKLGRDVLASCANLTWHRDPDDPPYGRITLTCPSSRQSDPLASDR